MDDNGKIYVVSTPIGNLEDLTLRSIRILKEVDFVCAEDTRRTKALLSHLSISKKVISYFEYSSQSKADRIIERVKNGETIALVSDAGTPGLSDPGAKLVAEAKDSGIEVIPIPGASALITALSVAGLPTEPLHFWGFLSPKPSKRKKNYEVINNLDGLHGFYVSPYKILKLLDEWEEFFSEYHFFIGREMTKKFETYLKGDLSFIKQELISGKVKGEFTVLISKKSFGKS